MSLETKLRLEIGQYELGSFGSSDCFFKSGRTMARLLLIGSFDARNDALHMPANMGEKISNKSFTKQVGTGSSWHCLAADFLKIVA